MLRQYFATKERYPGVLLAMRVGDFYEFYGEDAKTAAKTLEITLTGREDGPNGRIPMAGVPYHSVEKYLARLIQKGFKVALCDQVEDPKLAKGLVKREVTRVMTPGTVVEDSILESASNNFLASASPGDGAAGISFLDLSTGEFLVTEISGPDSTEKTIQEIARLNPSELLLPEEAEELHELIARLTRTMVTRTPFLKPRDARNRLLRQFGTQSLAPFGLEDLEEASVAAGSILDYLDQNEIESTHIDHAITYSIDDRMRLDTPTVRSLELTQNMVDGSKRFTLLETLDQTKTPMGARLLKRWIEEPLLDLDAITERHESVDSLLHHGVARGNIRECLAKLYDIQRLVGRAATGTANPRDLIALRASIALLPSVLEATLPVSEGRFNAVRKDIDPCEDLLSELNGALTEDPPITVREGGIIRSGYDPELDELRRLGREGKQYIASLEASEKSATGIEKLKVGYNSVFGYYLEVPKTQINNVPERYIRKQTTANTERYITAELKEYEAKVLGSEEKAFEIEYRLFNRLRDLVATHAARLLKGSRAIAEIDAIQSFAEVAATRGYVRPKMTQGSTLAIQGGRHPVVEAHASIGSFVPNDTRLGDRCTLIILTGPNMSGKSTYLRQTALIALMAQAGCFVPAESAEIGIVDRVFARIGARDELASGQSTFMVEMTEAANILHHATEKSLVILDEIGRGTSTFDGLAIAWAISERLAEIGAKTLFATHYHQLNSLADQIDCVANFRVAVKEEEDRVVWLHKVLEGGTDRSYGIQVARMAGIPRSVLDRAAEVLADLEGRESAPSASQIRGRALQLELFQQEEPEVMKRLRSLDTTTMTPVEALVLLDNLKREYARKDG
jgi:DNA mismatch repair protein MutS